MYRLNWNHAWPDRLNPPEEPHPRLAAAAELLRAEAGAGRLPFLDMPYLPELMPRIEALTPRLGRFRHLVLLGIGGSALGARALQKAFFPQQDRPGHAGPWLWIADNVDAATLEAWLADLKPAETLVLVVSKSGGTIETLSQYFLIRPWLERALGAAWTEHCLFVTDAHKGYLREEAERCGITALPVPDHLGGRYSVLSAVGLIPAAFLGLPWRDLVEGALDVTLRLTRTDAAGLAAHPAWKLAVWADALARCGYSQLIFFVYVPQWAAFKDWFAQLWAESLGKDGKGTMPLPAVGVTDQHSLQQMFLDGPRDKGCLLISGSGLPQGPVFPDSVPDGWRSLRGRRFGELLDAECLGSSAALAQAQVPLLRADFGDAGPRSAGELMGLCMAATWLAGVLMELNPLDQPAVELGKRLACAHLGFDGFAGEAALLRHFLSADGKPA